MKPRRSTLQKIFQALELSADEVQDGLVSAGLLLSSLREESFAPLSSGEWENVRPVGNASHEALIQTYLVRQSLPDAPFMEPEEVLIVNQRDRIGQEA